MGKTAVVVALILANAAPAPSPKEPFRKKLTIVRHAQLEPCRMDELPTP